MFRSKVILKIFVVFFFLINVLSLEGKNDAPFIEKGVLDLTNWDFKEEIKLSGAWAFYWNELLYPEDFVTPLPPTSYPNFPSLWNKLKVQDKYLPSKGFATYHLIIKIPDNAPPLGIQIPDVYTSHQMWINGKLIAKNGEVGVNKKQTIPNWLPMTKIFTPKRQEIEIIFQIANFHHGKGGISQEIYLGESTKMKLRRERELILDFLSTGSLLMGGLFFLGLFLFSRHDKAILYFALFCLSYSYREIGTGLHFLTNLTPYINWWIRVRLIYLDVFLSVGFFGGFVYYLFPQEIIKPIVKNFFYGTGVLCAITIFLPPVVITSLINYYLVVVMLLLPYILYVFILASLRKREGANYAFLGFLGLFIAILINTADYFNLLPPLPLVSFILFLVFIFSLSLILANRFAIVLKKAAEAAKSGTKSKSEFLATMSHEIRTPMNGVIGMTTLLSQTQLSEEQTTYVDTIRLSGENLITVINDILDFSKIESGKMKLEEAPFELEAAIESVFDLHHERANKKGLNLYYKIMPDVPPELEGDITRLKQILINLMSNAIKFTDRGYVFVKVSNKSERKNQITLQIDVEDTGVGIVKEKLDELFEQFSQVEHFMTRKHGGTGLGLAISRKLVQIMSGQIWVNSEEHKGSVFSFTAKLNKQPQKEVHPTQVKIPALKEQSILLVSDDTALVEVIEGQLKTLDVKLVVIKNNFEVKKYFLHHRYELVLLDNHFEEKLANEMEFAIRTFPPCSKLPIIILNIPYQSIAGIKHHDYTYFIHKPFKASIFRHTLKNIYAHKVRKSKVNGYKINGKLGEKLPLNILIAEDHAINQRLVLHLLKKQGYIADAVGNGKEAVEATERQGYDIILMDVQMPEMDGLEATRNIVQRFPNGNRPFIIAMTANAMQGDREMCLNAGMDDYISKPLKAGILEEKIQEWGSKVHEVLNEE